MQLIGEWGGGERRRARLSVCDGDGDGERSEQRSARRRVRANGQLGGDLSALLGGVLVVDAWRAGPMPAYGRQMGRAAITGHHAAGNAYGRLATEAIRFSHQRYDRPTDDAISKQSNCKSLAP